MTSFKVFVGLLLAVSFVMFALTGCGRDEEEVYVSRVEQKPLQAFVFANGFVKAQELDEVYVERGSRIINVMVQEGATVNANQALFTYGDNRTATSSIDGVVTNLNVRRGMEVGFSEPAVVVMSTNRLNVRANVRQIDIANVLPNQEVQIMADGVLGDRTLSGTVENISKVANRVDEEVYVQVDINIEGNAPEGLRPGMKVRCNILMRERQDAIVVGMDSIVPVGNDNFVYVVSGERLDEREVTLGVREGYDYEVTSGLDEGEVVVRNPLPYFQQGMPVRIIN